MIAVDTNILIYVHDPRDPEKKRIATTLIDSLDDGLLLWQVACEYMAASRKLVPFGFDLERAMNDVATLRRVWTVALPKWAILDRGHDLLGKHALSFWDAMIVSASIEAGATRLYSEDLAGHGKIDGLEIVDPFRS